jgi:thiol-disulfide isomerase/thioredoxin
MCAIVSNGCLLILMIGSMPTLNPQAAARLSETSPQVNAASLLGKQAPDFVVSTFEGRQVSLHEYRGRAVLVNFWATWCGNCKLEMPWLAQLREQYRGEGFEVLGIVTDDAPPARIASITQRYGVKYPILMCNHKTAQAYGRLPDLPESFFIDRSGRIVAEMDGADSKEQIDANIRKALVR